MIRFALLLALLAPQADDVADVPSQDLKVKGDPDKRYFLIGPPKEAKAPEEGFNLVVVLPGGDGSADFLPFVKRIFKNALSEKYLAAQLVSIDWTAGRPDRVVWPTEKLKVEKMKFTTEEFVEAVIADVGSRRKINSKNVFTLSWSSGGPAAYAASLAKWKRVTGSFVAMSVFRPEWLPPLKEARGHAYYLYHSPADAVCPYSHAEKAVEALKKNEAKVELVTYEGGHGWRGPLYADIRKGIEWLEKNREAPAKTKLRLRVAGAQIPVVRDVAANVAVIKRAIDYAEREKADVLVTPEGSLSGYTWEFDPAATARGIAEVTRRAREAKVALALGTCFKEEDGHPYDEVRFYDKEGKFLGYHAKILLCRRMSDPASKGEIDYFKTKALRTFELEGLTVGGLVCNDMWANPEWTPQDDPHLSQQLSRMGARVIFHSVNAGAAEGEELALTRAYHESNLRIRARGGRQWIVVANACDPKGERAANAPSGVLDPQGNWVTKTEPKGERFFAATIEVER